MSTETQTNLSKEVSRKLFLEHPLLRNEVEEVLAGVGPLHDDDEAVHPLEVVHQPHHAWAAAQHVKQTHLQGNFVISNLSEINII